MTGDNETDVRVADEFLSRAAELPALTPEEHTVLRLVAEGFSNSAIGARVGRSAEAVRTIIKTIRMRWQVKSRMTMVVLALQHGVLHLHDLPDHAPKRLAPLSLREAQVVAFMAVGLSRNQISTRLGIPSGSVSRTVRDIQAKWNVRTTAAVVGLSAEYLRTAERKLTHSHEER